MRHRREDVVEHALDLLARVGLPDLTMRRLATELDVRPSALYHHFPNKQALLGAVADRVLGTVDIPADGPWDEQTKAVCGMVRERVLAFPDGADLVATMWAFGLGGRAAYEALFAVLGAAGLSPALAGTAARTALHFVYGHALDQQAHAQASRLGAVDTPPRSPDDFETGLDFVVAGIRTSVNGAERPLRRSATGPRRAATAAAVPAGRAPRTGG